MPSQELYVIDDTDNRDLDNLRFGWLVATTDDPNEPDFEDSVVASFRTEIMAEWFTKVANSAEGVPINAD